MRIAMIVERDATRVNVNYRVSKRESQSGLAQQMQGSREIRGKCCHHDVRPTHRRPRPDHTRQSQPGEAPQVPNPTATRHPPPLLTYPTSSNRRIPWQWFRTARLDSLRTAYMGHPLCACMPFFLGAYTQDNCS